MSKDRGPMKLEDLRRRFYAHLKTKAEGIRRIQRDGVLELCGLLFRGGLPWPYRGRALVTSRYVHAWDIWLRWGNCRRAPGE